MGELVHRLRDASRSGVYRVRRDAEVLDAAQEGALTLRRISLQGIATKAALLERLAAQLKFPAWFGDNWDALEDCLTDVHGYLVFSGHQELTADDLGVLVDVLASVAEYWAGRGEPFFAIFIDPAGALPIDNLFREA